MMLVLVEGSLVIEFVGRAMDAHLDSKRAQARHVLSIEIRDGAREQRNAMSLSFASSNRELVSEKDELDFETSSPEWNGRTGQAARRDVQGHVPPMILQRSKIQTGLSHDLGPHVERVACLLPVREGKRGPLRRN